MTAGPTDAETLGQLDVAITYLEMRERPSRPAPPPPLAKLALIRAEQPTVSFYRYLYDTVGEPWLWYERRQMGDEELAAIVSDEKVEIYVLSTAGVPAGFAELDFRRPAECELAYFGLIPDFIGRGFGRFLLACAIETAWRGDIERLWVNTCTLDHPQALPMYQRAGFVPYDRVTRRIDDPRTHGIIPTGAGRPAGGS